MSGTGNVPVRSAMGPVRFDAAFGSLLTGNEISEGRSKIKSKSRIKIKIAKTRSPRPDEGPGRGQMGGGSSPRSLSRADIWRHTEAWLPASRRYSPRQAEYSAS